MRIDPITAWSVRSEETTLAINASEEHGWIDTSEANESLEIGS